MTKKMSEIISSPYTYAVIVAIAAFIAAFGSRQVDKVRKEIAGHTKNLIEKADSSMTELKIASSQINKSLEETKVANQKLDENKSKIIENLNKTLDAKNATINAQNEIIGQLTGGDSFPRIEVGESCFYLVINGNYSIPDCEVEIVLLRDYFTAPFDVTDSYVYNGKKDGKYYNTICRQFYPKLWINGINVEIPFVDEIYDCVKNADSFGFDIFFVSSFKRWKQEIRFLRFPERKSDFGVVEKVNEEKPSLNGKNEEKVKRLILEISDSFPTEFIEQKTKKRFCYVDLYHIEDENKHLYQPNFVTEMTKEITKLPIYNERDFKRK